MTKKHTTQERVRDAILTSVTGSVAMASLAHLNHIDIRAGATLGLALTSGAWTALIINEHWPKGRRPVGIPQQTGESVLVNGRRMLLRSTRSIFSKSGAAQTIRAFPVYHEELEEPKILREGQVYKYAALGWGRQLRGERYPFAARWYKDEFDKREITCLYRLLGEVGAFNTYGQGKRSLLVIPLSRLLAITRRRYSHAG